MRRKIILILEIAILGLLIFGWNKFLAVDLTISMSEGTEIGEEIIVYFNQPIVKKYFEDNFKMENPELAGEFAWRDSNREVHIVPFLGFGIADDVKISSAKSFALTSLKKSNYSLALKQEKKLSQNIFQRTLAPIDLPQADDLPVIVTIIPEEIEPPIETIEIKPKEPVKIKEQPQNGKYIEVDIGKMTITAYEDKKPVLSYTVAGIGNPAISPTPTGQFTVLTKHPKHFSSISKVWMPWSVQFYGPYFLHGVPYWPSGEKLNTRYSGGCVRLPEEADKAIYDFVEIGTPVLVYKSKSDIAVKR